MRPGLHNPGALPLLLVIVFSLLTLVPSLPSISSLKLTDLSYFVNRGHHVPLIQDNVADLSCAQNRLKDSYTPWIPPIPSRPRIHRSARPARLANGTPMVSCETAPVENRSRSAIAAEPSFLFSRRAHAFRTYFIQQLDDYQLLSPFSTRISTGGVAADANPTLPPTYSPSLPTSIDASDVDSIFQPSNESTYSPTSPSVLKQQQLPLSDMWQQVCQTASGFWDLANESPNSPLPRLFELATYYTKYAQSTFLSVSPQPECQKLPTPYVNISQPESQECSGISANTSIPHVQPNDQSTDAAGRHSSQLQGSCMAVVIGLVAGIVWF